MKVIKLELSKCTIGDAIIRISSSQRALKKGFTSLDSNPKLLSKVWNRADNPRKLFKRKTMISINVAFSKHHISKHLSEEGNVLDVLGLIVDATVGKNAFKSLDQILFIQKVVSVKVKDLEGVLDFVFGFRSIAKDVEDVDEVGKGNAMLWNNSLAVLALGIVPRKHEAHSAGEGMAFQLRRVSNDGMVRDKGDESVCLVNRCFFELLE